MNKHQMSFLLKFYTFGSTNIQYQHYENDYRTF